MRTVTSDPAGSHARPAIVSWGRGFLGASVLAMLVGGVAVEILGLRGRGIDAATLAILVPIWAAGIAGLVLLLAAWIRYPALYENRAATRVANGKQDEHSLGPLTQGLILVALILCWIGTLGLFLNPADPNPLWLRGLVLYMATCYCVFMLYLMAFYRNSGHDASTTYWHLLTPPVAFILIPLTWPLMVLLNGVVVTRRACQPDAHADQSTDGAKE